MRDETGISMDLSSRLTLACVRIVLDGLKEGAINPDDIKKRLVEMLVPEHLIEEFGEMAKDPNKTGMSADLGKSLYIACQDMVLDGLKEGSISSELIKNTLRKINTPEHIIEEFNQSFIDPINQQLP